MKSIQIPKYSYDFYDFSGDGICIICHFRGSDFIRGIRGLERSELGGSHGCPGRLWDRFL